MYPKWVIITGSEESLAIEENNFMTLLSGHLESNLSRAYVSGRSLPTTAGVVTSTKQADDLTAFSDELKERCQAMKAAHAMPTLPSLLGLCVCTMINSLNGSRIAH